MRIGNAMARKQKTRAWRPERGFAAFNGRLF